MGKINISSITRENVRKMLPYSSARDEFQGSASVMLDANENPFNAPLNRYPDPHQRAIKVEISKITGIREESIFLGNGSDEAIDLLIRAFCEPGISNIISIDPSYGMYEVCANTNDIEFRKVLLNNDFSLNPEAILSASDNKSRIIFLCSPNNPTSNLLAYESMLKLVNDFKGLVVIDEAYIDFASFKGMLEDTKSHNNLVILRTFSKAWGMAGIRMGMAFANKEIISVLNKIKYPYNINILTQEAMLKRLSASDYTKDWVEMIVFQREKLRTELADFKCVIKIYPSDANFLLVKIKNATEVYNFLKENGVIVRDRSRVSLCENCLRITVGSEDENYQLINLLKKYEL
jgi:histidinol-phosphate aminotransferase